MSLTESSNNLRFALMGSVLGADTCLCLARCLGVLARGVGLLLGLLGVRGLGAGWV